MKKASLYKVPHLTERVISCYNQQKLTVLLEHLVIIIKNDLLVWHECLQC